MRYVLDAFKKFYQHHFQQPFIIDASQSQPTVDLSGFSEEERAWRNSLKVGD